MVRQGKGQVVPEAVIPETIKDLVITCSSLCEVAVENLAEMFPERIRGQRTARSVIEEEVARTGFALLVEPFLDVTTSFLVIGHPSLLHGLVQEPDKDPCDF